MVSNNFIRKNENQFDGSDVSNFDFFKIMSGQGIFIVLLLIKSYWLPFKYGNIQTQWEGSNSYKVV